MRRDEPFAVRKKCQLLTGSVPGNAASYGDTCAFGLLPRSGVHVSEREDDVRVSLCSASNSVRPTGKQFLARLDLRVRLNANDDLPTWPSAVLPNLIGTGLAGAVRSAICPER
jgi:hypothetical protein